MTSLCFQNSLPTRSVNLICQITNDSYCRIAALDKGGTVVRLASYFKNCLIKTIAKQTDKIFAPSLTATFIAKQKNPQNVLNLSVYCLSLISNVWPVRKHWPIHDWLPLPQFMTSHGQMISGDLQCSWQSRHWFKNETLILLTNILFHSLQHGWLDQ